MRRAIWIWRPEYYEYQVCISMHPPYRVDDDREWNAVDKKEILIEVLALILDEPAHDLYDITTPEAHWIDSGKVET